MHNGKWGAEYRSPCPYPPVAVAAEKAVAGRGNFLGFCSFW